VLEKKLLPWKSNVLHIVSVCRCVCCVGVCVVCVALIIQHERRMHRIFSCDLNWLYHVFSHYLINGEF
jgi:hypothetical protein